MTAGVWGAANRVRPVMTESVRTPRRSEAASKRRSSDVIRLAFLASDTVRLCSNSSAAVMHEHALFQLLRQVYHSYLHVE